MLAPPCPFLALISRIQRKLAVPLGCEAEWLSRRKYWSTREKVRECIFKTKAPTAIAPPSVNICPILTHRCGLTQQDPAHGISMTLRPSRCGTAAAKTSAFQTPKKRNDLHMVLLPSTNNQNRSPANTNTTHSGLCDCCFRVPRIHPTPLVGSSSCVNPRIPDPCSTIRWPRWGCPKKIQMIEVIEALSTRGNVRRVDFLPLTIVVELIHGDGP